jgi:hypothetical protein
MGQLYDMSANKYLIERAGYMRGKHTHVDNELAESCVIREVNMDMMNTCNSREGRCFTVVTCM